MTSPKKLNQSGKKERNGKRNLKGESLDQRNKPFSSLDSTLISSPKKQEIDFETKRDLIRDLDEDGRKKTETAQDIFYWLNGIAIKKNQKNNQYLFDFKRWLLEKLKKGDRGKKEVWNILKRVYRQFTVHGQKTNGAGLNQRADIDGAASLFLLELAGFTENIYDKVTFVDNENSGPGVNIDTSEKAVGGISVEGYEKSKTSIKDGKIIRVKSLFGTQLFFDEHGNGPCSSTRMIYQILKDFDQLFKKEEDNKEEDNKEEDNKEEDNKEELKNKKNQVKRFVSFVDVVDDLGYQASGIVSPYLERTIFGLYKNLPIRFIFEYFKDPNKTGFEYLDDKYLEEHKLSIFDVNSHKKEEKTLKQLSNEKKYRMTKGWQEINDVQSKGYFLMYGNTRFVVDLGGKITDGPETANIAGVGIIRLFPSTGDFYIYSPNKLPSQLSGFDVKNGHFIVDKIGSGKDLNKLLSNFSYVDSILFFHGEKEKVPQKNTESIRKFILEANKKYRQLPIEERLDFMVNVNVDDKIHAVKFEDVSYNPGSRFNLKKEIVSYRQKIIDDKKNLEEGKELLKKEKSEIKQLGLKTKLVDLPEMSLDDVEVAQDYDGIINSTHGNIVYVTIDKNNEVRGILHKNNVNLHQAEEENKQLIRSLKIGDRLSVKVKEINEKGIQFSLNEIVERVAQDDVENIQVA